MDLLNELFFVKSAKSATFVFICVYQIGRYLLKHTPWGVFSFIPDVDEMIPRKHREGVFAAVMTFSSKTMVTISTCIVNVIVDGGGFVQGETAQSHSAIKTTAMLAA